MTPSLESRYLGLDLRNPLVASPSPMTGDVDALRKLQDAGVAAVVLPSLFEEQLEHEEHQVVALRDFGAHCSPEAETFFPDLRDYNTGPGPYLELLEAARGALEIPVLASLNGSSRSGWVKYARRLEDAGASAIELNVYYVPTDPSESAQDVEDRYLEIVRAVRAELSIPLAVKIGPAFTALPNLARRLVEAGANGLVLFNRLLRPDMDLETLTLRPSLQLSDPWTLRLPLQWIAILHGRVKASLAASGGVRSGRDAAKLLLAGADVVMATSALLRHGPAFAGSILQELEAWMLEGEYASVAQLRGSMSHANCPDPSGYERANYMRALVSYSGEPI